MSRQAIANYAQRVCHTLPLCACLVMFNLTPGALASEDHSHYQHQMASEPALRISQAFYDLPDIKLVSSKGQSADINSVLSGEAVIVNFIFTTCTAICPIQSTTFSQLDKALEKEGIKARLVSISIDPEKDTPETLARYARKYAATDRWIFLTGDKRDIVDIQKAFHAFRGNKMNHEPIAFIRKDVNTAWTRVEGFSSAADIISEYKKQ